MSIVETSKDIERIASEIGTKNWGFENVAVSTAPFKDFKVKWTRTTEWIKFKVSDYVIGMPENAVRNLFENIFSKMLNGNADYGKDFTDYVFSKEFLGKRRATYLNRSKVKDAPYEVFEDTEVYFYPFALDRATSYSTFFNVIFISNELRDAPKDVLDTIIADTYNSIQDCKSTFNLKVTSAYIEPDALEKAKEYIRNKGLVMM